MGSNQKNSKKTPKTNDSELGPEEKLDRDLKRMALILGWMLIAAGGLWAAIRLWPILSWIIKALSPFLIALVVAYLFNPIVNVVQKKFKLGRIGGIAAVGGIITLLFVLFFGLLLPILYIQTTNILSAVKSAGPEVVDSATRAIGRISEKVSDENLVSGEDLEKYRKSIIEKLKNINIEEIWDKIGKAAPAITQGGGKALGGILGKIREIFSGVTSFFLTSVLALIIAIYYLLEFDAIPKVARLVLPDNIEDRALEVMGKVDVAVGGFLRGQLIVCSLVALVATVGLSAIGMYKYALLVGVVAGAANFIPYLGPVMGAAPAILWALLSHTNITTADKLTDLALVIGLFGLIQVLDGFVFQPRIVGKSSNLHPLAVMAALVIGGQFGLAGMILAVPLACIARVLFKELWWDEYIGVKKVHKKKRTRKKKAT